MPHKLKKIRKKRGTRTVGYGRVGQHRKGGSKGFTKSGRHKHLWSYVLRYEPDYFKKVGFISPKSLNKEIKTLNVGELEDLAKKISLKQNVRRENEINVNLNELGFQKLLGKGKVINSMLVKVASCSETATKKIEAAGGKVLIEK